MKMTLLELMNSITNKEAPYKIKYDDLIWVFKNGDYYSEDVREYLFNCWLLLDRNILDSLNKEAEIIFEKNKKIEELEISKYKFHNNNHSKLMRNQIKLQDKINEIIRYLNNEEKNNDK